MKKIFSLLFISTLLTSVDGSGVAPRQDLMSSCLLNNQSGMTPHILEYLDTPTIKNFASSCKESAQIVKDLTFDKRKLWWSPDNIVLEELLRVLGRFHVELSDEIIHRAMHRFSNAELLKVFQTISRDVQKNKDEKRVSKEEFKRFMPWAMASLDIADILWKNDDFLDVYVSGVYRWGTKKQREKTQEDLRADYKGFLGRFDELETLDEKIHYLESGWRNFDFRMSDNINECYLESFCWIQLKESNPEIFEDFEVISRAVSSVFFSRNRDFSNFLIEKIPKERVVDVFSDAISSGDAVTVAKLIEKDPDVVSLYDRTGDMKYCWFFNELNDPDFYVSRLLIDAGFNLNALHEGVSLGNWVLQENNILDIRILRLFLDVGVDANCEVYGDTHLYDVANNGFLEAAKILIEYGADVNQARDTGDTPFSIALEKDHIEIAKLLIDSGVDVNGAFQEESYLAYAARNNFFKGVKLLLESGADVNQADDDEEETPLLIALEEGHMEIAKLLIQKGAQHEDISIGEFKKNPEFWAWYKENY